MDRFGQYNYTRVYSELSEEVKNNVYKELDLDITQDNFTSAAWIENFMSKGKIYILITKDKCIDKYVQIKILKKEMIIGLQKRVTCLEISTAMGKELWFKYTTPLKSGLLDKLYVDISS